MLKAVSRQHGAPFFCFTPAIAMCEEAPRRRVAEGELTFSKLLSKGVCKGKNLRGESDEAFVAKQTHLSLNGVVPIKDPFCTARARTRPRPAVPSPRESRATRVSTLLRWRLCGGRPQAALARLCAHGGALS